MLSFRSFVSIAIVAASLAGCNNAQVQTQDNEQGKSAGENNKSAPDNVNAEIVENSVLAKDNNSIPPRQNGEGVPAKRAGEKSDNAVNNPSQNNSANAPTLPNAADANEANKDDAEPKPCGPTTLSAADAEKWDCVPTIGYWCTDPEGCPVDGNLAYAGVRLAEALPVPQGTQYEKCSDTNGWECNNDAGCKCGAGMIKEYESCHGDEYAPRDASETSACNQENCKAICRGDKCVCGDTILTGSKTDGLSCEDEPQVCTNKDGCEYQGKKYAQNEKWKVSKLICENRDGCACGNSTCKVYDTCLLSEEKCITPDEFECEKEDGCPCGKITCDEDERCITAEGKCIDEDGNARTTDKPVSDEQDNEDEVVTCSSSAGCKCGSQLCPKDFKCINDLCVYYEKSTDQYEGHKAFYCDKPEGCWCGYGSNLCPRGAVCDNWDDYFTSEYGYLCFKVDKEKVKDEQSLFEFLKGDSYDPDFYNPDFDEHTSPIFSVKYFAAKDVDLHQNYYLDTKDGKEIGIKVFCSDPGCDCKGVPLEKDYICVEQHVVFAHGENDAYNICLWPYYNYATDEIYSDHCEIADNVYEQICFNPKGCACGSGTIKMGDACVNGHAHCSTRDARNGCTCGTEKLDKGYGCYHDQLICQTGTCKCHGKDIHLGDVCTKEGVVCGANSYTTGCLCGETPLKEGYRCLQKEQICACGSQIEERDDSDEEEIDEEEIGEEEIDEEEIDEENEKTDDSNDTDTKSTPCTCQCGEKTIESGVACNPTHPPIEIDKSKCGNLGAFYENMEEKHIKYNGQIYKVDESIPEMAWLACTCGTGLEAPGEGYVCAFKSDVKGYADVHMDIVVYAGWICTKMEGCACGENICDPGALCVTDKDGGKSCSEFNNIDRTCKELSEAYAYENGYKCYYNESEYAKGWYCDDVEGCACGEVTCEQYQMCLAPGYCSKNKLTSESEQQMLNRPRPIIKLCKEDDDYGNHPDCEYAEQSGIQVTPWASETPNPLLHYVPESSAYLAATRRQADGQSKEITTLFEGFLNLIEDGMDIASYMPNNYDPNNAALNLSDWGIDPTGKADAALYAHRGYVVMHVTVNDEKKAEKQVEAWLKMLRTALTQKSRQLGNPCMKYFDDGSCRFWAMTAHAGNSVMQLRNEFTKWKQLYLGYHVGEGVLTLIIFDKKMWDGVYLPRDKFTWWSEDILLAVKTTYDETSDPLADQITEDVLWVQRKPYQPTEADYHGAMIYRIGQKQAENAVFVLPIDDKAIDEAYIKSHFMTE